MIHGFVGAGKTTFSKQLEQDKNAVRFSPDEWIIARHGHNPSADLFADYLTQVKADIRLAAASALQDGRDVIFDFGFWSRAERDEYRNFAKNAGVSSVLYHVHADKHVMQERALKRTADLPHGALVIDENAIALFWSRLEPLAPDEAHISVKTD